MVGFVETGKMILKRKEKDNAVESAVSNKVLSPDEYVEAIFGRKETDYRSLGIISYGIHYLKKIIRDKKEERRIKNIRRCLFPYTQETEWTKSPNLEGCDI